MPSTRWPCKFKTGKIRRWPSLVRGYESPILIYRSPPFVLDDGARKAEAFVAIHSDSINHRVAIRTVKLTMGHSIAKELGMVFRNLRLSAGYSQEELANRSGLHRAYIGAIERGEKVITVDTASKISDGLGVRLSEIFLRLEQLR